MAYKHYNHMMILRMMVIVAAAIGSGILINAGLYYIAAIILLTTLFLMIEFIRFINKTNKQINYFIHAVKNEDTSLRFPKVRGNKIMNELNQSLNELNTVLQQIKVDSKIKERYFSSILQNLATGVVVLSSDDFVDELNPATLELLGLQTFTHLSQLERIDPKFKRSLAELKNKQKKVLVLTKSKERIQIVCRCSVIKLEDKEVKLITLQDIRGELERKEIDSWVKLIRVMSHEIMNSLTPVTSIAQSLQTIWKRKSNKTPEAKDTDIENTIDGLGEISKTGGALINFVQSYRMLSKTPEPDLISFSSQSFFDRLNILLSPMKEEFSGSLQIKHPKADFEINADEQMMVQVIINLVKNAIEALGNHTTNGKILVSSSKIKETTEITVIDNGNGIPEDLLDDIFIPFFTTKNHGSGIGLSYSRQILRAHGGSLICRSRPGQTVFTVRW